MTPLPGIGTRQDFEIRARRRVGVVNHRDGRLELIVSKADDPDACTAEISLTPDEATTLANLLGAPQLVENLRDETREVAGITTKQFPINSRSPYDGRSLGDTQMRTRTSVSIVAVMRAGTVHPSPRPDFTFAGGDLVVVVGTKDGLTKAAEILDKG